MNNTDGLITCPVCNGKGKRQVLGRLSGGGVVVKRYHMGLTTITSQKFDVACECGFVVMVSHGTISGTAFI